MKKSIFATLLFLFPLFGHGQETPKSDYYPPANDPPQKFPEIKGYVGIVHPLYTWSADGNQPNFRDYYLVGMPWGLNIWKSKKVGLSFEFTPFFKTDNKGGKMSNFLFHPGICYRLGHEFTFIGRLAFETSGRVGFTPILNRVWWRGKDCNFFTALLFPARFGNNQAASLTVSFQFGLGF